MVSTEMLTVSQSLQVLEVADTAEEILQVVAVAAQELTFLLHLVEVAAEAWDKTDSHLKAQFLPSEEQQFLLEEMAVMEQVVAVEHSLLEVPQTKLMEKLQLVVTVAAEVVRQALDFMISVTASPVERVELAAVAVVAASINQELRLQTVEIHSEAAVDLVEAPLTE
jgi:hypothetical protein